MKTIEAKLYLTSSQQATIDSWMDSLRWAWNEGLALLLERHHHKYYDWLEKQLTKQGISTEGIRRCYLRFSKKNAFAASCPIAAGNPRHGEYYPISPLPVPEPRLRGENFMSLSGHMTRKRYPEVPALQGIPMDFVKGVLKNLADAWAAYKNKNLPDRHILKFKSHKRGDRIRSLYCLQPEGIGVEGDLIKVPGAKQLGMLKSRSLQNRWRGWEPRTVKIVKEPSGYYVQLTGNLPERQYPDSDLACGIDVGVAKVYSDDAGHQVDSPRPMKVAAKRLRRMQRKLARQRFKNPDGSNNAEKTKQKIARLHERVRRQRRGFSHWHSYKIVNTYGGIAVEDLKLKNMVRRPKAKERDDGKGWEQNGAKRKSGLNRSLADVAVGQLVQMIQTKAESASNREFSKVVPHRSSQECSECGHTDPGNRLSQSSFKCLSCGHKENADVNASKNIRQRADFVRSYRACTRKVMPAETCETQAMTQESIPGLNPQWKTEGSLLSVQNKQKISKSTKTRDLSNTKTASLGRSANLEVETLTIPGFQVPEVAKVKTG